MPSCSKAKNKRNVEITFTEQDHKYKSIINGSEIEYISGTTFISKFFPVFDPTGEITKRCARKKGLTVEALKEEWKIKADNSCKYGTKIHETCEDILLKHYKLRNKPNNLREELTMNNAIITSNKILERAEILGVEKIIFDENLRIAGTIDLLIKSKKDGSIWICDWKTNEHIDTENKYSSFALKPIEHIPNTNMGHYTMQLNLYEYILKYSGYIDNNIRINKCLIHLNDKHVKTYIIEDRQDEIKKMIDYEVK